LPSSVFVFFFLGFVRVLFFIHRFKVEGGVPACLEQNSREACFARLVSEEHCGEIVLSCRNTVMARVFAAAASVTTPAAVTLAVRSGETGSFSVICKGAVLRHGGQALQKRVLGVRASTNEVAMQTVNGVVFEPFSEVQDQLVKVTTSPQFESLARQRFAPSCEAAINDQINVEYNVSYIYHALHAYFDRDNVGLPGLAQYFKDASDEERDHAEKLMRYQNQRGGKVKLQTIVMPVMEFDHPEKGDALYAMELALALEKLTNEKLLQLHQAASDANDPQMTDFIEGEFLTEQVEAIKKVSEYVSQLRRVGKGLGVYHFDLQLQEAQEPAAAAA
jgi:ferritin heavy chain